MSVILRLQREKAETQMEFRQFKRFAEEKMLHDSEEIAQLEDLLYKKERAVQSLSYELQEYKRRLLSYEIYMENQTSDNNMTPTSKDSAAFAAAVAFDYPGPKCKVSNEFENANVLSGGCDLEKYALGEMPCSSHDKGMVAFSSPSKKWTEEWRRVLMDSYGLGPCASKVEERDDLSDRVYTVDAVHCGSESYTSTPRNFNLGSGNLNDEINRLYAMLQALEVDRETMKHTIMSMSTDKTQPALLKEIAQQLCKEAQPQDADKKIVKKQLSSFGSLSVLTAVKDFYAILSESDIRMLQEGEITNLSNVLSVLKSDSCVLCHYSWDVNWVQHEWFVDEAKVHRTVGLLENSDIVSNVASKGSIELTMSNTYEIVCWKGNICHFYG